MLGKQYATFKFLDCALNIGKKIQQQKTSETICGWPGDYIWIYQVQY